MSADDVDNSMYNIIIFYLCFMSLKLQSHSYYTASQKFLNSKIFNVFLKSLLLHQACIYLIQSTAKTILKYVYYLK